MGSIVTTCGLELHALLAELVHAAHGCGAGAAGRLLAGAISTSEQGAAARAIRRAFTARGGGLSMHEGIDLLDRWERLVAVLDGMREDGGLVDRADVSPVERAAMVDVVGTGPHLDPMSNVRSGPGWPGYVDGLVERGEDAKLVELAAEIAGTQEHLAALSGLTEESISRGHTGSTHFSPATREWFRRYLCAPTPPPPMPKRRGPKARAGAVAPQVWVDEATHMAFAELAVIMSRPKIMEWILRSYLKRHRRGKLPDLVVSTLPREHALRERVDPDLLASFDARVGGPDRRVGYLIAAVEEGLPLLAAVAIAPTKQVREGARKRMKRAA